LVDPTLFAESDTLALTGPFRLSALVGARMVAGEGGSMINISSIAAHDRRCTTLLTPRPRPG
jgi:short-subunit dehydrogenase